MSNLQKNIIRKKVRLYHYTKTEILGYILNKHRLKLTHVGYSNDPIEFLPDFSSLERTAERVDALKDLDRESWRQEIKDDPALMLCLSQTITSPSMWSLYADKHKGVCLAFDIPIYLLTDDNNNVINAALDNKDRKIIKVIYQEERPCFMQPSETYSENESFQDTLLSAMQHKGTTWREEKEIRLIVAGSLLSPEKHTDVIIENNAYYYKGIMGYLSGIILGVYCPLTIAQIENDLRISGYKIEHVIRAKIDKHKYRITNEQYNDEIFPHENNGIFFVHPKEI